MPARDLQSRIEKLARQRILLLDGGMGTMAQAFKLTESDFRGDRFANHSVELKGDMDVLCLSRPEVVAKIHRTYLESGADIIETNTFGGTSVAQADYQLEPHVFDINVAAAQIARRVADEFSDRTPDRPRFVAGALGPTPKTLSISPDVNDPGLRALTFDQLRASYAEQVRGLLEGGVDLLLLETIIDTLNAKAALVAIDEELARHGERVPLMISMTITDQSGRTLSGQTVEAFWHSVAHARPMTVGINCALGAEQMRPFFAEMAPARVRGERLRKHSRRLLRHHPRSHSCPGCGGARRRAAQGARAHGVAALRRPRDPHHSSGVELHHGG
jgi:5-methyltetrahydrofolate--homocysteine methyltransferase